MERPRVAILNRPTDGRALIPSQFNLVGEGSAVDELSAFHPDLVLLGFREFPAALKTAEQILTQLPSVGLVMVGPSLQPPDVMRAMRAGVRDVLSDPSDAELVTALEQAWAFHLRIKGEQAKAKARAEGRVFVIHSPKGGTGKSTLAVNLACVLREQLGKDVVLVDLALHSGDLDLLLNVKTKATWADLAQRPEFGPDELETALVRGADGLSLLAAPSQPEDAELVGAEVVERAIAMLRRQFPLVVVDTGSILNEATFKAIDMADRLLMPLPLTLPALRQAQRALRLWSQLGVETQKVEVMAWDQKGDLTLAEVEQVLQRPVAFRLPHDQKGVEQSLNAGEMLVRTEPRGSYAKALMNIAESLLGRTAEQVPEKGLRGYWKQLRRQIHVSTQQA